MQVKVYAVIAHLPLPMERESTMLKLALMTGPRHDQGEGHEQDVPHRRGAGGVLGARWMIIFPHMGLVLLTSSYANGEEMKEVMELLVIMRVGLMILMMAGAHADPRGVARMMGSPSARLELQHVMGMG